mgnify:CR=1 FL=1|tara:strand:+ start:367 stop:1305 length:939 start_codon:yes stop_codon:yes gene_type:complete
MIFPEIEPSQQGLLKVSELHSIYWERSGNPKGKPILILHGGPGGGSSPMYRRFFDPKIFDIVQFDQRGCGQSIPHSELKENSTNYLIEDIEKLRHSLKLKSWHVFGGSWGSTLSLIYAIQHPDKVISLTLRGIFLCRKNELSWFYQKGASEIFPEEFDLYQSVIPINERGDLIKSFYKKLTGSSRRERSRAANAWTRWEMSTSYLTPKEISIKKASNDFFSDSFARIECHYFINNIFLEENYILNNINKINNIPVSIVQGRYDIVCPMRSAWDLNKSLPSSKLYVINNAGHSMKEFGITKKLIELTNEIGIG